MLQNDALAKNFLVERSVFWKKVKNTSRSKVVNNTTVVNEVNGDANVAEMWRDSFEKLYNAHDNEDIVDLFDHCETLNVYTITHSEVLTAIRQLKQGKSCGPDGIPAEAIIHSGHLLSVHLNLLFNKNYVSMSFLFAC